MKVETETVAIKALFWLDGDEGLKNQRVFFIKPNMALIPCGNREFKRKIKEYFFLLCCILPMMLNIYKLLSDAGSHFSAPFINRTACLIRMDEVYELRMGLRLASEVCEQQGRGIVAGNQESVGEMKKQDK